MQVFLSHAAEDAAIAQALKQVIEQCSLRHANVWFSSDTAPSGGMTPGGPWFTQLLKRLKDSQVFLAVLTPNSVRNLWVLYEAGCAGALGIPLVPLAVGISVSEISQPLSLYNAMGASTPDEIRRLLMKLFEGHKIPFDEVMLEKPSQIAAAAIGKAAKNQGSAAQPESATQLQQIMSMIDNRFVELIRSIPASTSTTPTKDPAFRIDFTVVKKKATVINFWVDVSASDTVQNVTSNCYFNLRELVDEYQYLVKWIIRDDTWGVNLVIREFQEYLKASYVFRSDHRYKIILLSRPYDPTKGPAQQLS